MLLPRAALSHKMFGKEGDRMQAAFAERYRILGLNVAYYRKLKGLSQETLAERVGISRTHMSRIETADCAVSLDVIFALSDALQVAPARLFDFRVD